MIELEQTLLELPKKYANYEKRIESCIEFLLGGLNHKEKEEILGKARHDFMFYLDLYHYQTYEVTTEDALDYAICTITRDREKSRKAICACSLFRITLRSCLCNCQHKIGQMVKKPA